MTWYNEKNIKLENAIFRTGNQHDMHITYVKIKAMKTYIIKYITLNMKYVFVTCTQSVLR